MKISPETINLLKNYATINQQIVINPGNSLNTIATNSTIVATAKVPETFEQPLAIFDLPQFLNIYSMFQSPDIDLSGGRQALIREGKTIVRYTFAEPSLIRAAPSEVKADSKPVATFELPAATFQGLIKAVTIMGLPNVVIRGDGQSLTIGGYNAKNSSTNTYQVDIGDTTAKFEAILEVERLKQMARDYRVEVTPRFTKFKAIDEKAEQDQLTYWIAVQENSKFN